MPRPLFLRLKHLKHLSRKPLCHNVFHLHCSLSSSTVLNSIPPWPSANATASKEPFLLIPLIFCHKCRISPWNTLILYTNFMELVTLYISDICVTYPHSTSTLLVFIRDHHSGNLSQWPTQSLVTIYIENERFINEWMG